MLMVICRSTLFAPEDVEHRFGAGLQTFLPMRASLRDLNVALQATCFHFFFK